MEKSIFTKKTTPRRFLILHAVWVIFLLALVFWWASLLTNQAHEISALEQKLGMDPAISLAKEMKTKRIIAWESISFLVVWFEANPQFIEEENRRDFDTSRDVLTITKISSCSVPYNFGYWAIGILVPNVVFFAFGIVVSVITRRYDTIFQDRNHYRLAVLVLTPLFFSSIFSLSNMPMLLVLSFFCQKSCLSHVWVENIFCHVVASLLYTQLLLLLFRILSNLY